MHNTGGRRRGGAGRKRYERRRRREMMAQPVREREMCSVDSKLRTAGTTRARVARTEAEINRRKSLLPSALSGPFRPAKIIYRKDWRARLLFPSDEFRDGPLGDAKM